MSLHAVPRVYAKLFDRNLLENAFKIWQTGTLRSPLMTSHGGRKKSTSKTSLAGKRRKGVIDKRASVLQQRRLIRVGVLRIFYHTNSRKKQS